MKKVLNNVEIGLVILAITTAILGFFPSKISSNLAVFSFMLLGMFYLFVSAFHFKSDAPKTSIMHILGLIGTGFSLSVFNNTILFKLMNWPGADKMQMLGLGLGTLPILFYGFRYFQTKSSVYSKILTRFIIFAIVSLCLFPITRMQIMELKYRNHPDYINAVKDYEANTDSPEKLQKLHEERNKLGL